MVEIDFLKRAAITSLSQRTCAWRIVLLANQTGLRTGVPAVFDVAEAWCAAC
jgi:hypothetical protein